MDKKEKKIESTNFNRQKEALDKIHLNVKRIRTANGITLRQLAHDSNLSLSYLSNYENGKVNITINSLKKIATALGVPVVDLITDNQENDIIIVPKEERYIHCLYEAPTGIAIQEYLMRSNKAAMHVLFGKLPPHSDTGEPSSHYGEEFILAIKGTISVIIDDMTYRIKEGDMIYYSSRYFHKLANEQDIEVEYFQVNTPPTF